MKQATYHRRGGATASITRLPAAIVAALAMVLSLAAPTTALDTERVVVTAARSLSAAAGAVAEQGGRVLTTLDPFGMLVATVPADRVDELTASAATADVTRDVPLNVQSADFGLSKADGHRPVPVDSEAGEGVGVVVVDTGIDNTHPALDDGKVIAATDFTSELNGEDGHGHGTFLAGLVAGQDDDYSGVAPGAHLVSVRVAEDDGSTDLSTLLQGLVAADLARERFNAPVVLLALSGPAGDVPDPVMLTLEMLWARGSTVVVAAGNTGSAPGSVGSPGADPYLITVGALNEDGDAVADYSGRGPTAWGHTKPDVVAEGTKVIGPRVEGSFIDTSFPGAVVDDNYFRGSGTSMSAAQTAGAAAVLLADNPRLTPDQVKGRLMGSATAVDGATVNDAGAGALDVAAALSSKAPAANTDLPPLPQPSPAAVTRGGNASPATPGAADRGLDVATPPVDPATMPEGWSWGGWSWGGWSWGGWSWGGWDWDDSDYWNGWSWGGWSWGGWSWGGWSWAGEGVPAGWSWGGWSWAGDGTAPTGWSWGGWSWAGNGTAAPAGWSWAGEGAEPTGWSWAGDGAEPTGWSWAGDAAPAGWSWSGWSWSGWSWSGWSWSAQNWS